MVFVIEASQQIAGLVEFVNARTLGGVRLGIAALCRLRGFFEPFGDFVRFNDGFVFSIEVVDPNGQQPRFIYVEVDRDFRHPRRRPADVSQPNASNAFAVFCEGPISVNDVELHRRLV